MSEHFKVTEQRRYIKAKLAELREFVNQANIQVNEILFARLYDLLTDSCSSIRLKPFTIQVAQNGMIGVEWIYDTGHVSVLFGPGDDWEWEARETRVLRDAKEGGDAGYEVTYRHSGECSFVLSGTHHYYFPDEVERMISLPDDFDSTYEPLLKSYEYEIVWVTNRYDGMLAGYLRKNGKLHYFDNVEETDFTRRRMFAVYELTWLERLNVWRRYHWWHIALASKPIWKWYWWIRRFRKQPSVQSHRKAKEVFECEHAIVGYFER